MQYFSKFYENLVKRGRRYTEENKMTKNRITFDLFVTF